MLLVSGEGLLHACISSKMMIVSESKCKAKIDIVHLRFSNFHCVLLLSIAVENTTIRPAFVQPAPEITLYYMYNSMLYCFLSHSFSVYRTNFE